MTERWKHRAADRPHLVHVVTTSLLLAFTVGGVFLTRAVAAKEPLALWPGLVLSAVACAVLLRRRSHPLVVLLVTTACIVAEGLLGYLLTPLLMGPMLVAQYTVSLRPDRRTTWYSAVAAAAGIALTGFLATGSPHEWLVGLVNPAAWVLMVASFGGYVRVRREYAVARAEHAAQEREEEARRRVVQERMRIARELHDVVAHHLALANAQAGTAAHLARSHPDQAIAMIEKLPEVTASALRELKATVGLLRQDTDSQELAPAPGLEQLPQLVATCASAGLDVAVTNEGRPGPLPPGLDLTAYRIVQEALTNVTKHAATPSARVRLDYTPHELTLTITNDAGPRSATAPGSPGRSRGYGLLGMRERALSVGGTFHAGPRPAGGFEVACVLPLPSSEESTS
ncbi:MULTISPECIES: sensor histidine kinase [unclassified Streptomyces]|uniref:sensor histidine kinase n=1 Tax=unclassified Streptomyces TaxID=2593676 RepID=UPI0007471C8A|nr:MULTISPECIES: sensor histidine kinase [unclassified Streptomyces]KUL63429.1 ATPase [Streptomyces sp. NRRL S-1521]THC54871.1 sensor histidine kinase [Streptomyces sp. A1499]